MRTASFAGVKDDKQPERGCAMEQNPRSSPTVIAALEEGGYRPIKLSAKIDEFRRVDGEWRFRRVVSRLCR